MSQLKSGSSLQGGKYRIEKVLGQGGFGITYLATQELLDRQVCIKEFFFKEYCEREETTSNVSLGTQSSHEMVERFMTKFLKEARTISQLDHPNIIRIHDIFKENNTAYYVMEYIEGESLSDKVSQHGVLPESEATDYIRQVASALGFIHQRSINHLDVKPANIMIRKSDNKAILIDFGLSKQYDEQGGQTSTTPVGISHGYAPMEQYKQGGVSTFSPQTDIYALGATLYKLVTGNTPPQAMDILDEGLPSLPASVSASIADTIKKAMQPRKVDRPGSIIKFLGLLNIDDTEQPKAEKKVSTLQQKPYADEETKILEELKHIQDSYTHKNEDNSVTVLPPEYGKKKRNVWIVAFILILLCTGGYFVYPTIVQFRAEAAYRKTLQNDIQAYSLLIGDGDILYRDGKYSEAKKKYEQAQDYERKYFNTIYSIDFNKEVEKKISIAYQGEQIRTGNDRYLLGMSEEVYRYLQRARNGYADAQNNLGNCYINGKGVEKNEIEAVYWYRKSAEQENAEAQLALGHCYLYGYGVEKNNIVAVSWYRKSAEQGNAAAQYQLGSCYENGQGIKKNDIQAVHWYVIAAEQGNADAQRSLGYCYLYGKGVEPNDTEAKIWFQKAAEQGDELAIRFFNENNI